MQLSTLLRTAAVELKQAGCDAPRLDAELLLMHSWQISRTDLIIRVAECVPEVVEVDFHALLQRRMQREPLAYLLGEKEFWSRPFRVTPDVLIPRPETEHLIEAVLDRFADRQAPLQFCDIGTGSGCIAVTLACEFPNACVVATDISTAALAIARRNAEQLGVLHRMVFRHGDMLDALAASDGAFHAIISNPPYVAATEMANLEPELAMEPRHALTDEQDGLQFLSTLVQHGSDFVQAGGYLILETGLCGLPGTPAGLVRQQVIHDLAGHLRGAVYQR